ncbi:hypothetical protein [Uliginosibacterium gangwonense]|uniref:hypothetical protein n=1 Tax=Uliginosibacterium gangwonense TaxID=392736 RepID=UPI0012FBCE52|nr:hypothetical protein [Uliginosibacterium gangwonense]
MSSNTPIFLAYKNMCSGYENKRCGYFSYAIVPNGPSTKAPKGTLIVMQFFEQKALIDVQTGAVYSSDIAY